MFYGRYDVEGPIEVEYSFVGDGDGVEVTLETVYILGVDVTDALPAKLEQTILDSVYPDIFKRNLDAEARAVEAEFKAECRREGN